MVEGIRLRGRYYRQYPPDKPLGHAEEELTLGLEDTAFLIIDVYGLGYDDGGETGDTPEFYKDGAEANRDMVVNHIRPAREAARVAGLPVVYLTNYLAPSTTEGNEWRNMSIRTCGVDVLESWKEPNDILCHSKVIAPGPGDYLIKKQMYSGFFETHLESLLKDLGVRNLVAVGFDLRICLGTTVTDAMYRNYRVVVLRDCTRTREYPETEEGGWANFLGIRFIEANVGYTTTSEAFVKACTELSQEGQ
ncbi:MAG: isochorismatase family cysteine hydrolase [Candidatus Latescibacteria bacterium]|jgi:ureidoacrylate peracid hydrolase|nr:isochorismatase family cysteine hydrolase [Candidatus Latescibacterota bacterium]